MRNRYAVGGAKTAKAVALHGARKALTLGNAGDINELARNEMARGNLRADIDKIVGADAELDQLGLGFDIGDGEVTAHSLGRVLDLGDAGAELDGCVAVLLFRTLGHHLAVFQPQNGHGHMLSGVVVDPGHSHFLCNHT